MVNLPFNQYILEVIADHRIPLLTEIFKFFTFLGSEQGYILLIIGIYWIIDKKFGVKIAFLVLLSSALNQFLKIIIRNPRPFVIDGTYRQKWAIDPNQINNTKNEFSTPSSHAMGSSTFWGYVYINYKTRIMFLISGLVILLIGLSRPYLGVHYFEDIIIGWLLGFIILFLYLRYEVGITNRWEPIKDEIKILLIIGIPLLVWLIVGLILNFDVDAQPFATFGGFLSGLLLGNMIEIRYINFDNSFGDLRFNKYIISFLRYILGVAFVLGSLTGLDILFSKINDASFFGFLLRYVRYTSVGLVTTIVIPFLFVKLGLASKKTIEN